MKMYTSENKPNRNAKNHGKLTKRTSDLHERATNSRKGLKPLQHLPMQVGLSSYTDVTVN